MTPVFLHGFGQRYDLPGPLFLYLFAAAGVVVLSFVMVVLFGGRNITVYREMVFIGVLLSVVVLFGIVNVGGFADVVFWIGTALWFVGYILLLVDWFLGRTQLVPYEDRRRKEVEAWN